MLLVWIWVHISSLPHLFTFVCLDPRMFHSSQDVSCLFVCLDHWMFLLFSFFFSSFMHSIIFAA
uniref:Uncharacterized protein n=1 Tax=Helianthus annuus TaxID=4232 RepID=A0A251UQ70_HELAN